MQSKIEKYCYRKHAPSIFNRVAILKSQKNVLRAKGECLRQYRVFPIYKKCLKTTCKCQNFIQRKSIVMLNPSLCTTCTFYHGFPSYCMYHHILMNKRFECKLCTDCLVNNDICFICSKDLGNVCGRK